MGGEMDVVLVMVVLHPRIAFGDAASAVAAVSVHTSVGDERLLLLSRGGAGCRR